VVQVEHPWPQDDRPRADAMVTDRPGLLLGILKDTTGSFTLGFLILAVAAAVSLAATITLSRIAPRNPREAPGGSQTGQQPPSQSQRLTSS